MLHVSSINRRRFLTLLPVAIAATRVKGDNPPLAKKTSTLTPRTRLYYDRAVLKSVVHDVAAYLHKQESESAIWLPGLRYTGIFGLVASL